ncbi:MAG: adenylyltransferase/cytidyltransferase family protein [Candidatus Liptonbacteria bacterium]
MKKKSTKRKGRVVAVSGGFDPVHVGHVRMFEEARKLGDYLVVILNNDNWLRAKKGYIFMSEKERREVIEALRSVDEVFITRHPKNVKDMSVCRELKIIKPHIFANGGDRVKHNIPEVGACEEIGTQMIFNIGQGGKVQSSSWLLANYLELSNKKYNKNK